MLEKILVEIDMGDCAGDVGSKYSHWLSTFSKQRDFLNTLSNNISESVGTKSFRRFNSLVFILQGYGDDSSRQKELYSLMMDFVNSNLELEQNSSKETETTVELVLDVFWHQQKGLKNLEQVDQLKLSETLKRAVTFRYKPTEHGEEPFFAISKSMDLITYQDTFGESEELTSLYLNHFDEHIQNRAKEMIKRL